MTEHKTAVSHLGVHYSHEHQWIHFKLVLFMGPGVLVLFHQIFNKLPLGPGCPSSPCGPGAPSSPWGPGSPWAPTEPSSPWGPD